MNVELLNHVYKHLTLKTLQKGHKYEWKTSIDILSSVY